MLSSKPSVYLCQNIQDNFFNSVPTTPPFTPPPPPKKGLCRRRFPTNRTDRGLKPRFFFGPILWVHIMICQNIKIRLVFFQPSNNLCFTYLTKPAYSMGGTGIDPQQN